MSGEAGGLEAVLAEVAEDHSLHPSMNMCLGDGCTWRPTPDRGSLFRQHQAHAATQQAAAVHVWLTEALASPEVVEVHAKSLLGGVDATWSMVRPEVRDTYVRMSSAALSAAADALRAGVTR